MTCDYNSFWPLAAPQGCHCGLDPQSPKEKRVCQKLTAEG